VKKPKKNVDKKAKTPLLQVYEDKKTTRTGENYEKNIKILKNRTLASKYFHLLSK
jgi:hypothetical protein